MTKTKRSSPAGKRIVGWTNNLIATSIVLVMALVAGRQLVALWIDDRVAGQIDDKINKLTDQARPALTTGSNWPDFSSVQLEFGDSPFRLQREIVSGTVPAQQQLLNRCQALVQISANVNSNPGPAELQLIEDLNGRTPEIERQGRWRLFRSGKGDMNSATPGESEAKSLVEAFALPGVIGVRDDCQGAHPSRLVLFGMTMPAREQNRDALFIFQASDEPPNLLPIPPGCQRTMTISTADGLGQWTVFRGGTMATVKNFVNRWAELHGLSSAGDWKREGTTINRVFDRTINRADGKTWDRLSGQSPYCRISVQLFMDENEETRGLIMGEASAGTIQSDNRESNTQ